MPEWYEDWFDSKYYHLLYRQRDEREAQQFIDNILRAIDLPEGSRVLDLACGRGRHSVYLNKLGYDVTGADLSAESISYARSFENDTLKFVVHDMREPLKTGSFDMVMNLFTSFGYFKNIADNERVLKAVSEVLRKDGVVVIDFLNAVKVERNLVPSEARRCGDITFNISRKIENGAVVKSIAFTDEGKAYAYQERVQLLTHDDFMNLFKKTGFTAVAVFGDYNLGKFDDLNSDRLILLARKTAL